MVSAERGPFVARTGRGQLVLIAALFVAVTILGSVVLLNSVYESPDVRTEQDIQSLSDAEWQAHSIQADLERVFLVNTSVDEAGDPLPYASNASFEAVVDTYSDNYVNLSTTERPAVTDIELVEARTGGVARQNETLTGYQEFNGTDDPVVIVDDADAISRLELFVVEAGITSSVNFTVRIEGNAGGDSTIAVADDVVVVDPDVGPQQQCSWENDPLAVDLTNGTGAVSTNETYCGVEGAWQSLSPPLSVVFENGTDARGAFTVTGVDPDASGTDLTGSPGSDNRWYSESTATGADYIVDPVYRIEYRSPNVAYNATYAPYNGTQP